MTKTSISLQDLRRKIYLKAKSEKTWRFWGLYVHVCKMETLQEAYRMAKKNNGAPGIDGVTFEAIEEAGLEAFLEQIRSELVSGTYRPMRNRRKEIPRDKDKVRVLGIPSIRDRVVQGSLKLILEPIFEADFQEGSYAAYKRLLEELEKLDVEVNREKTRMVDLIRDETFSFLGFDFRRMRTRRSKWGVRITPRKKARTALLQKLNDVFRRHKSQPVDRVIYLNFLFFVTLYNYSYILCNEVFFSTRKTFCTYLPL